MSGKILIMIKRKKSSRKTIVNDKLRILSILAIVLMVAVSFHVMERQISQSEEMQQPITGKPTAPTLTENTYEIKLSAGWNLIALPAEPYDLNPANVFKGIDISGNLHRYDPSLMSYVTYMSITPSKFGPAKSGEGYWLWVPNDAVISYNGRESNTTISLSYAGWYLIGLPMNKPFYVGNITVARFNEKKTLAEARKLGWVSSFIYYNPKTGRYVTVGTDSLDEERYLKPGLGYWFNTAIEDLELSFAPRPPVIIMTCYDDECFEE